MRRGVVAVLLLIAFVLQGTTSVLAGTTGSLSGTVTDANTGQPIAGARVTATSPSQTATATTDATGRYSFVSLTPDTYTVSVPESATRLAAQVSGVTVQADQNVSVNLPQTPRLKQIGSVTSRAAAALVKPGTTADVYSINAVTQDKSSALGGGGTLNQAWSAISSVPGVYVAPNQQGYIGAGATVSIRGGDYDQIGYELDGIPVNRAFDNYPSGPLSSLGQQELQVYTGAPSATAEANGISGFINQVIRTGTAPASRNLTLALGTPTQYDKLSFEAGGANPARTFSYYIGAGAYNQSYRYYDNYNGASLQQNWGTPVSFCQNDGSAGAIASAGYYTPPGTPGCYGPGNADYTNGGTTAAYVMGPYQANVFLSNVRDRDTVANFHFGIPRKDGNRDDVQLLFDNNFIANPYYSSTNDLGGAQFLENVGLGVPVYQDGYQTNFTPGQLLPFGYTGGGVNIYYFPQSPTTRATGFNGRTDNCSTANLSTVFGGCIEPDRRDQFNNNQSIQKVQYQRNFGTNAFLRVYGYTYYSDWLQTGPQTNWADFVGYVPGDYELSSHTRGVSAQFVSQLNPQHLLSLQASYTTSRTLRDNNTQQNDTGGSTSTSIRNVAGVLVDSSNPYNGQCYTPAGAAVNCFSTLGTSYNGAIGRFTYRQAYQNGVVPATGTCGGGPCEYMSLGTGAYATYNQVVPKFASASISDQWKPSDRLSIDLGLRFDSFVFQGSDTTNGGQARNFMYNAWNRQFGTTSCNPPATTPCPQTNVSAQTESYSELQPRLGLTYTINPSTVIRAAYGRYAQAPNSAFEQYNFLTPNAPALLRGFVALGVGNTPAHAIRPSVANNYDFSFEHQFNRDTSVKLTPFIRKTQDQIQQFFLDQKTNFVSGLNVGRQTSQGVEFELDKGDFSRNGWAGRLTYTYTNSYVNYTRQNGLSVIDNFNTAISAYDAFTRAGGGAPCYTTGGAADPTCAAGSIANPYYNAPPQPLMDPNAKYTPYDLFPAGVGSAPVTQYGAPHVATLLVQYKHGPLAITPALQFSGGIRYGVPLGNGGIDPSACGAGLAGTTANDPRYPYGAAGGSPYDATACGQLAAIPNIYTGKFDNIGAFAAPNNIQLHTQVTWDVNKRVTLVGNFANIVNRCFGGTKVPWSINQACGYTVTYGAGSGPAPVGNVFNPGNNIQPFLRAPYDPLFPGFPFNMYFEARIKI